MSNAEAGFEPSWGASVFKCKHCDKDGMQWKQIAPDIWRPYDLQDKKLHSCDVVKDEEYMQYQVENTGSITLESLVENLELLGFKYFVPRTVSWKFALAKSNTIQTVYFLIGRSGVDFKLYDSVRDNNVDDNGKLYTDGGKLVRNYYWKSNVNIHHLILKVATQLSNNIPIDDEFLTGQGISVNTNKNSTIDVEEYDHSAKADKPNKRNGHTKKTVRSDTGDLEISTPRDRGGSFEPVLVSKHQTRISGLDDKIIFLYAKGQTTTEIVESIKELYDVDISSSLVSRVTDNILEDITAWQNRPLSSVYPIIYLDCIVVKVRQDKQIINKAIYLALGVGLNGKKELLGMWLSENEGAKFWLGVLTELQNRGVQDILIACVDDLKGFPDAINTVYPNAQVQPCIVHMVRYSMKFVPWTDKKAVAADLKAIYGADTLEIAEANLEHFDEVWGDKYPHVVKSWRSNWEGLTVFFEYPKDIRKAIYTTNAIESLNSVIRTAVNKRKVFPSDQAAFKVVYLATQQASKKWSMPIRNWTAALNRFMIMFDDRISRHLI